MKKIVILGVLFVNSIYCVNFITYADHPGRLGDQILTYTRTKFLAHVHNLKFCYKPFRYSDQLVMHGNEYRYNNKTMQGKSWNKVQFHINQIYQNENYICCADPTTNVTRDDLYRFILRNKEFGTAIKSMVAPNHSLTLLKVPKDKITVAVHVRKGSCGDRILSQVTETKFPLHRYEDYACPQKFPSDEYFIDQIRLLSDLLNDIPMYVYIFTDAQNPYDLMKLYEKTINKENIEFACRMSNYESIVLEDFFSMAYQFDCLIRGISCFAYAAQCIGNHKIIICTKHGLWQEGKGVFIDNVNMIIRNANDQLFYNELKEDNYQKIQEQLSALWSNC